MFSQIAIMVVSIVACCLFSIGAILFFVLWIVSLARNGLQKTCLNCSAKIPSSAHYCTHCGCDVLQGNTARGGRKSFLILFAVCIIATGLSIGGIVYGAISSGIGDSQYTLMSVNVKQNSTSSGWNISFDSIKSGWFNKTISIDESDLKTLHVLFHFKSGSARLTASNSDVKSTVNLTGKKGSAAIDLKKFESGRISLTLSVNDATGGAVDIWWE